MIELLKCPFCGGDAEYYSASGWLPIESAPKDGTEIFLFVPYERLPQYSRMHTGKWEEDEYAKNPKPYWKYGYLSKTTMRAKQPTHWMPLPGIPNE